MESREGKQGAPSSEKLPNAETFPDEWHLSPRDVCCWPLPPHLQLPNPPLSESTGSTQLLQAREKIQYFSYISLLKQKRNSNCPIQLVQETQWITLPQIKKKKKIHVSISGTEIGTRAVPRSEAQTFVPGAQAGVWVVRAMASSALPFFLRWSLLQFCQALGSWSRSRQFNFVRQDVYALLFWAKILFGWAVWKLRG